MKWSYSSWSLFKQCPMKYKALRIDKRFPQPETQALMYGKEAHKAAELYIKDGTPLPPAFSYMRAMLDCLKNVGGVKHCELELGLTKELQPCDFHAPDVWWRGIIDLLILQDTTARIIDYKTGKSSRYADIAQLEILSLAVFKHFPKVVRIKTGLLFVVAGDFIDADFTFGDAPQLWLKWINNIQEMEEAERHGTYNAKPNFTCRNYCPVTDCVHHGE